MNKGSTSWPTFLLSLGFFLVAISPLTNGKYLNIISGISLIALGYYLTKKKNKNK
ncbi:LPXTG cell wall anchor domain-containing protein [Streptococcus varani]|uniref:LPXTG cell wall anchor domain-containing protein n=1 Tax=Streptococcus varani TaxID=1608583 RepID=UPI001146B676